MSDAHPIDTHPGSHHDPDTAQSSLVDLLHPVPALRLELDRVQSALDFAFASGDAGGLLEQCLESAEVGGSDWDPSCFASDVFVAELVEQLPVRLEQRTYTCSRQHLGRLLAQPPADPSITRFRQAVSQELAQNPTYRQQLEQLYMELRKYRALLESPNIGGRLDMGGRRMDVLISVKAIIDAMAEGFEAAHSALSRLRTYGRALQATEAYRNLAQLLDFEDNLANVDVRLRVGRDGSLRGLQIVQLRENEVNRFYASPLGRLLRKLMLFLRGYRFRDGEVVGRLVDEVFVGLRSELVKLFQLIGDLEFYLVGLGVRDLALQCGLEACLPSFAGTSAVDTAKEPTAPPDAEATLGRRVTGLFNPLLAAQGIQPVPCDLEVPPGIEAVIITGPNSGGKTRLLQSLALTQMLGQAGLFVPAASAELGWADGMFVSLSQEVSADQQEGRLGTELLRIRTTFERLRFGSVVMLDELCSGTNPSEGEEIFRMVVTLLGKLQPQAYITTHFLDFANRLASDPEHRLLFLQVELDASQQPTYQFVPGVAKTSLAQRTAARLGVTQEQLLQLIDRQRSRRRA